jgi:hypothetical protein
MSAPMQTQDPVTVLRAECDLLRLMLALLIREKINSEFPMPEMGMEVWGGAEMASVVSGLSGPNDSSEQVQARLDALSRFTDSLRGVGEAARRGRDLAGHQFAAIHAQTGGDD